MHIKYIFLLKHFIFCLITSIILFSISFFLIYQVMDIEKVSSYECGFNPFSDSRVKFEIRFYLVGILFIIFDLEISLLFPWLFVVMEKISFINGIGMSIFILLLLLSKIRRIKQLSSRLLLFRSFKNNKDNYNNNIIVFYEQ
jgi:NADH-quinone oxidoreductase subunit A